MILFGAFPLLVILMIGVVIFAIREKHTVKGFIFAFTWPVSVPLLILRKIIK